MCYVFLSLLSIFCLLANWLGHLLVVSFFFMMLASFRCSSIEGLLGKVNLKKDYTCCNNNQNKPLALEMCLLLLLLFSILNVIVLLLFDIKGWVIYSFITWDFYLILLPIFTIIIQNIVMFVLLLNTSGYLSMLVKIVHLFPWTYPLWYFGAIFSSIYKLAFGIFFYHHMACVLFLFYHFFWMETHHVLVCPWGFSHLLMPATSCPKSNIMSCMNI